jgi:thioredoxin domain-containing protein 5
MFYPIWQRLIDSYVGQTINFYRVDCIAEKEFCTSQKAIGFPTLHLFVDGELMEEYQGGESINELKLFTDHHLRSYEGKKHGHPHPKYYKSNL